MRLLKIGTSWVRGVVGDAMPPELVVDFACAFGTTCGGETVVVGRDPRRSSPLLHAAVCSGLISTGCDVVDLGICSTPLVSHAVRDLGAAGGISITGSHNDARWNALKFVGASGALLNAVNSEDLLDIYHARSFLQAGWDGIRRVREAPEVYDRYLDGVVAAVNADAIRDRAFRVAIDFCNGSAARAGLDLLERLGCRALPLNEEPTGEFAHAPAPSPSNMRQLAGLIRYLEADLGAAINIDGDRIGLVTADATALSEEMVLPLTARHLLFHRPGLVVTNLSTSRKIDAVARQFGQTVIRTQVGEGYVVDRAILEGAVIGGEGNGGVAPMPVSATFDALHTLAIVLEAMALSDLSLADLAKRVPVTHMLKGELACPPDRVHSVLDRFAGMYRDAQPDATDGIRFDWPDAWLHVRASNTEPLLRVIAEADTPERADDLFGAAMRCGRRAAAGYEG